MARPRSPSFSEFAAISAIEKIFTGHVATRASAKPSASRRVARALVEVGIGDDAAVVRAPGPLVWTVDSAIEHVHFERAWLTLEEIGARSFHAAVSDVCAMGGVPRFALSSIVFPRGTTQLELATIARGQNRAAKALDCRVIGGNLARGGELGVTTTVLGQVSRPILRSGARPGDELWLCGEVGLAAAGLKWLQRGAPTESRAARRALAAFRRPAARLREGLALVGRASSAIDVSDGLCGDAEHVAARSGVAIVVSKPLLEATLSPALSVMSQLLGLSALDLALYGGEDYALLATGPTGLKPKTAQLIGWVTRGQGVWLSAREQPTLRSRDRQLVRAAGGFEHRVGRNRSG